MATKAITINIDEELLQKIEASAKANFRKRGPEINVAIAYYLSAFEQSGGIIGSIPQTKDESDKECTEDKKTEHETTTSTNLNAGAFSIQ